MAIENPLTDENIQSTSAGSATEPTKEELEARRAEITKYYEEHIPSLKTQLEYEGLLRDIEKVRAERLQAQMFVQNTMAGQQQGNGVPPIPAKPQAAATAEPKKEAKRTLKKTVKENA